MNTANNKINHILRYFHCLSRYRLISLYQCIAGLDAGDLMDAGMRKGDTKTLMRNVSEQCVNVLGGDDSSFSPSGLTSSAASGNTTTTETSVATVESYVIAASRSSAQATATMN